MAADKPEGGQSTPAAEEHLEKKDAETAGLGDAPKDLRAADGGSIHHGVDILALQDLDPALNMKMHLVNNVVAPPMYRP